MSQHSKYVIRPHEVEAYSPANHTGTRNRRLVGPRVNGSRHLEIVLGEIERNEGALAHAHPDVEQAVYVLEGEAEVEIDDVPHTVRAGDLMYFPARVFHSIKVTSPIIRMLVIYGPPYDERPEQVILKTEEGRAVTSS
ncbi:MAG: cupin domain-containing protein [Pseudorhodoplanes sp.]|jgi:quercetin dioxygenase-like cupin family protein